MAANEAHILGVAGSNPAPVKRAADGRNVEPGKPLNEAQTAGCRNRSVRKAIPLERHENCPPVWLKLREPAIFFRRRQNKWLKSFHSNLY